MNYILVPIIVVLVIMVVISLVRGIVAFLNSTKEDLNRDPNATGPTANQLLQNKMMFNRIKYQAAAVLVCALLLAMAR
ncbi:glutamyl-tRNA synthetase [Novosphingobium barchaimii LL02]|uniref:Glutamyl-tRNA synthetase n=1 Tax=Novosphingobium barchaimii LL02 TaxID=1114963 RepID=A0A0J7XNN2_9SPHN|nr:MULTISPECIES: HIG1 domain-containing protein [Novosphingobium]AXB75294.1 twin transmembrane helix small protein [Novosphingobium sp. P6W]KIS32653.1 glutamyl-tRNA synthetase [Novosphingobium sp. P6W]KMS52703.1 glutamyl-tRNA synthetase [Novosphingobium barchaimii LL02]